ncbi:MAG: VOC family protein [Chitinophagales bacterium]|nr:VOC family protein [Hyphomicrobiales bacterium]
MSKYTKVTPHLTVKGGLEAIKFYEEAFDAEVEDIMMAQDGVRVLHAELEINDGVLFLNDEFLDMTGEGHTSAPPTAGGASVTMHLSLKKAKQVDRMIAQAASAGAQIIMPAEDVFWGARYGRVRDPFGHVWSFGAPVKKKDKDDDK